MCCVLYARPTDGNGIERSRIVRIGRKERRKRRRRKRRKEKKKKKKRLTISQSVL